MMKKQISVLAMLAMLAAGPVLAAEAATTDTPGQAAAAAATGGAESTTAAAPVAPAAPEVKVDPAFMEQWSKLSPEQRRAFFHELRKEHRGKGPGGRHAGMGRPNCGPDGKIVDGPKAGEACEKGGPGGRHGWGNPEQMKERFAAMTPEKRAEAKARLEQKIKDLQELQKSLEGM